MTRIALVTGASRGIGHATALALNKAGAHVIATARSGDSIDEILDLLDLEGISRLADKIRDRFGRLDILVGNAAILGPYATLGEIAPKEWDTVMRINVSANFQLIRTMDALLRRSVAGRVVFLTSSAPHNIRPGRGLYSASKAALEVMAYTYAAETKDTNVRVNLFDPGRTRTQMRAEAVPDENPMMLPPPENAAEKIVELCMPTFLETGQLYRGYAPKK